VVVFLLIVIILLLSPVLLGVALTIIGTAIGIGLFFLALALVSAVGVWIYSEIEPSNVSQANFIHNEYIEMAVVYGFTAITLAMLVKVWRKERKWNAEQRLKK